MENRKPSRISITVPAQGSRPEVIVQGRDPRAQKRPAVDLVFVVDTTGSMSDKIDGIIETISDFLTSFADLGLDYRVAFVAFGDLTIPGDHIVRSRFMTQPEPLRRTLQKVPRFNGGGNEGESALEAIEAARGMPFRPTAVKVLVLITDEPALQHQHDPRLVTDALRRGEIVTYVISPAIDYYRSMAATTGGSWSEISSVADFSALLAMLRGLAAQMSKLVEAVHRIAGGSVQEYLRLNPRSNR